MGTGCGYNMYHNVTSPKSENYKDFIETIKQRVLVEDVIGVITSDPETPMRIYDVSWKLLTDAPLSSMTSWVGMGGFNDGKYYLWHTDYDVVNPMQSGEELLSSIRWGSLSGNAVEALKQALQESIINLNDPIT